MSKFERMSFCVIGRFASSRPDGSSAVNSSYFAAVQVDALVI